LADIDVDGNLGADEFCVAMYLIDMAKMGQTLPATLPPSLIPPSMQRLRRPSEPVAATQLPCNYLISLIFLMPSVLCDAFVVLTLFGWASGRASGIQKLSGEVLAWLSVWS